MRLFVSSLDPKRLLFGDMYLITDILAVLPSVIDIIFSIVSDDGETMPEGLYRKKMRMDLERRKSRRMGKRMRRKRRSNPSSVKKRKRSPKVRRKRKARPSLTKSALPIPPPIIRKTKSCQIMVLNRKTFQILIRSSTPI